MHFLTGTVPAATMLVLQTAHDAVLATVGAKQYKLKCPCNTEDVSHSCSTVFQSTLSGIAQVMDLGNTCTGHLIFSLILLFVQLVGMVAFSD